MKLQGKAALITGAASGIGRSIARLYASEGAKLVLVDRDEARLAKVSAELTEKGAEVVAANVDLLAEGGCADMVQRCLDAYGRIDILCNNAGVLDNLAPAHACDDELWRKVMGVNTDAPFRAIRAALPAMIEQESGSIVNTASAAGEHGGRGGCAYTVSKHAVIGLTRSVAWFYGAKGIRCNAIAPGSIQTRMAGTLVPDAEGMAAYQPYFATIPRFGKAMEVAQAALFLGSDDASYINGAILPVDGGWVTY
jgi:NAD(P)-dependent dehydrogenase (short-subunit alcohol dehydrogenase family)